MTMFIDIDDNCTFPTEEEVACASSQSNGQAQPDIVRHKDEHQEVADDHLQNVQDCLYHVRQTHHCHPEKHR